MFGCARVFPLIFLGCCSRNTIMCVWRHRFRSTVLPRLGGRDPADNVTRIRPPPWPGRPGRVQIFVSYLIIITKAAPGRDQIGPAEEASEVGEAGEVGAAVCCLSDAFFFPFILHPRPQLACARCEIDQRRPCQIYTRISRHLSLAIKARARDATMQPCSHARLSTAVCACK